MHPDGSFLKQWSFLGVVAKRSQKETKHLDRVSCFEKDPDQLPGASSRQAIEFSQARCPVNGCKELLTMTNSATGLRGCNGEGSIPFSQLPIQRAVVCLLG